MRPAVVSELLEAVGDLLDGRSPPLLAVQEGLHLRHTAAAKEVHVTLTEVHVALMEVHVTLTEVHVTLTEAMTPLEVSH